MKRALRAAFPFTIPVLFGYLALGFAYGLFSVDSGLTPLAVLFSSMFVFAGAMQFVLVGLFQSDVSLFLVAVLTFSINSRLMFYGLTLLQRMSTLGPLKPFAIHMLTDETYALITGVPTPEGVDDKYFLFSILLLGYIYWAIAATLGALFGAFVHINTTGLDFAMAALLIALFTDQWLATKEHRPALIGIGTSLLTLFLFGPSRFVLPALFLSIAMLFVFRGRLEEVKKL